MRTSTMIFIPAAMLILVGLLSAFGLFGLGNLGPGAGMIGLVLTFIALTVAQREERG